MTKDGHAVAVLSGDQTVNDRILILDRFREGLEKVLISTNVLARGKRLYLIIFKFDKFDDIYVYFYLFQV